MSPKLGPFVLLLLTSCITDGDEPAPARGAIDAAAAALGGEEGLKNVKALKIVASGHALDPWEAAAPGEAALQVNDYQAALTHDLDAGRACTSWTTVPIVVGAELSYTTLVDFERDRGMVDGREGLIPQPTSAMSAGRLARELHTLRIMSPHWLVRLALSGAAAVKPEPDATVDGAKQLVATITAPDDPVAYKLFVDAASGLPARIVTLEDDPVVGDGELEVSFSDWRDAGSVKVPGEVVVRYDGETILEETRSETSEADPASCALPDTLPDPTLPPDSPAHLERIEKSVQWYRRFAFLAAPNEIDLSVVLPTLVSFEEALAPNVYFVAGVTHHSMLVELADSLVLVEAPINSEQSQVVLAKIHERWPDKPISALISTHFHFDHVGGARDVAAEGASVYVTEHAVDYYTELFAAPHTIIPDALAAAPRTPTLISVQPGVKVVIGDEAIDGHTIELYNVSDLHVKETLVIYLPTERILFQSDMFNAGFADPHFPDPVETNPGALLPDGFGKLNATHLADVVIPQTGTDPLLIVGGHGFPATRQQLDQALGRAPQP